MLADLTLLLAWNAQEAGRIIETYKVFEHKPPDLIMEKQEGQNNVSKVISDTKVDCLKLALIQNLIDRYQIPLLRLSPSIEQMPARCYLISTHYKK